MVASAVASVVASVGVSVGTSVGVSLDDGTTTPFASPLGQCLGTIRFGFPRGGGKTLASVWQVVKCGDLRTTNAGNLPQSDVETREKWQKAMHL